MNKVLIVVAHNDDEVLGCGGTISRHIKDGDEVRVLIATKGTVERDFYLPNLKDIRNQSIKANSILGVRKENVFNLGFPDQRLDTISEVDLNKSIEYHVNEFKPNIVYTHFSNDLNKDHELVSKSCRVACRTTEGNSVNELYEFPVVSSSNFNCVGNEFEGDTYIDITDFIENKKNAMKCYEEEVSKLRSDYSIEVTAMFYGLNVGHKFSEVFKTIRRRV